MISLLRGFLYGMDAVELPLAASVASSKILAPDGLGKTGEPEAVDLAA